MPTTYKYKEKFQRQIAATLLQDIAFFKDYEDVIDPQYFDFDYLTTIVKIASDLIVRHGQLPSQALMEQEVHEHCLAYKIPAQSKDELIRRLRDIYSINIIDSEAVKERVIRFGREQAFKSAIIECGERLEHDELDFEKALKTISEAVAVGTNSRSLGMSMFGKFLDMPELAAVAMQYADGGGIPTGIDTIDAACLGGEGPRVGQVWTVMGLPGAGKSQFLVNTGALAVLRGIHTVHITLGDLDEVDCGLRYSARLSKLPIHDIVNNTFEYQRKAAVFDKQMDKYLRIKYWPSHTATMSSISAYISKLVTIDNIRPGLVIIDYPDELRPTTDNDYQNMGRIYSECEKLAAEYGCLVWTASQVQRWRAENENDYITLEKIADSWRKAAKADGILSWNQTPREWKQGLGRVALCKLRRGKRLWKPIPVKCDFSKSLLTEISWEDYDEELHTVEDDVE